MSNIIVRLKKAQKIGINEKNISEYIIKNINNLSNIDIRELAKKINSSPSGITRFVKKLGYDSFLEFKYEIKNYKRSLNQEILSSDFSNQVESYTNKLTYQLNLNKNIWIKENIFAKITEKIELANKVFIFAQGGTYSVAYDLTLRLQRIGYNVMVSNDLIIQETLLNANNDKNSLFIIFSFSGETDNLVKISQKIVEKKYSLVSFTSDINNSIKNISDLNIPIFSEESSFKFLISGNRIMFMFAIDILMEQIIKNKKNSIIYPIINTSE